LPPVAFDVGKPLVVKIPLNAAGDEYLLVENRQPISYDQKMRLGADNDRGGLAIWHIDLQQVCRCIGSTGLCLG
jgi:hypothetical protein